MHTLGLSLVSIMQYNGAHSDKQHQRLTSHDGQALITDADFDHSFPAASLTSCTNTAGKGIHACGCIPAQQSAVPTATKMLTAMVSTLQQRSSYCCCAATTLSG